MPFLVMMVIFSGFFFIDRYLTVGHFVIDYVVAWGLGAFTGIAIGVAILSSLFKKGLVNTK